MLRQPPKAGALLPDTRKAHLVVSDVGQSHDHDRYAAHESDNT